jgi:glycosyltransferase involved in cell wall biosynthesis
MFLIFSDIRSVRLDYLCALFSEGNHPVSCSVTDCEETFLRFSGRKIWYSRLPLPSGWSAHSPSPLLPQSANAVPSDPLSSADQLEKPFLEVILPEGLLQEQNIRKESPLAVGKSWDTLIFPLPDLQEWLKNNNIALASGAEKMRLHWYIDKGVRYWTFDLFSAVFWLVTRMEEYHSPALDRHGRFQAIQSLAWLHNFLEIPLVDYWKGLLVEGDYPKRDQEEKHWKWTPQKCTLLTSFDLDFTTALQHRSLGEQAKKIMGSFLPSRKGLWRPYLSYVTKSLLGKSPKDPFDSSAYIRDITLRFNLKPHFFLLLNQNNPFDMALPGDHPDHQKLVKKFLLAPEQEMEQIGLHPSYYSSENKEQLEKEVKRFQYHFGSKPRFSRQHFLKFTVQETYPFLEEAGIEADCSMGYGTHMGFRASTAYPFVWFNLNLNKISTLKIFPVAWMDVQLSPTHNAHPSDFPQQLKRIKNIWNNLQLTGCEMYQIWHNHTVSGIGPWKTWRSWLENILSFTNASTGPLSLPKHQQGESIRQGVQGEKKKILVLALSDLISDQRIYKTCISLVDKGFEPFVLGIDQLYSPQSGSGEISAKWGETVQWPYKVQRLHCPFSKGPMRYLSFNFQLLRAGNKLKFDAVWSNDLDTLFAGKLLARKHKVPLLYDSHEFYTGQASLTHRKLVRGIWSMLEKKLLPSVDWACTVNQEIALRYYSTYGVSMQVMRNVPLLQSRWTKEEMPEALKREWERIQTFKKQGDKILLMQGAGINPGQGYEEMIAAISHLPEQFKLVVIGSGLVWQALEQKVKENRLSGRIIFIPRMPFVWLKEFTQLADLGGCFHFTHHANNLYSLPNKLFDYMMAEVPVLASETPAIKSVLEKWQFGRLIPEQEITPLHLAKHIEKLFSEPELLLLLKQRAQNAAKHLNWEKESIVLNELVTLVL